MTEILVSIARTLVVLVVIAIASGKLGEFHWFLDLFSHWQLQYSIVLLLVGIIFAFTRRWILLGISFFIILFISPDLMMMMGNDKLEDIKLYFVNAHYRNADHTLLIDSLKLHQPKLLSIVEITPDLAKKIKANEYEPLYEHFDDYKSMAFYRHTTVGGAAFSNIDVDDRFPYPIGQVQFYDTYIYTIHPFAGFSPDLAIDQQDTFQRVLDKASQLSKYEYHIFVGDFNTTAFSPIFRKYFKEYKTRTKLSHNVGGLMALPIDYALSNITDLVVQVGESVGSDHRPLLIDFSETRRGLFGSGV